MCNQLKEIRFSLSFVDKYDDFHAEPQKNYEEYKQVNDESIDLRKQCDMLAAQAITNDGNLIE